MLQDDVDIIPVLSLHFLVKTAIYPEGRKYEHVTAIPLGKPLISALPIWRRRDCPVPHLEGKAHNVQLLEGSCILLLNITDITPEIKFVFS